MCSTMNEVIERKERKNNWVFFEDCAENGFLSKHSHDSNTACDDVFLEKTSFSSAISMYTTKYDTSNLQIGSVDDDLGLMKERDVHFFRKLSREDSAFSELSYGSSGFSHHCHNDRVHRGSAVSTKNEAIDELQINTEWEGSDHGGSMDPSVSQCEFSNGMGFSERNNRLDSAFSETEEVQSPIYLNETKDHTETKDMFPSYDPSSVIQSSSNSNVDNCGNPSTNGSRSVELDVMTHGLPQSLRGATCTSDLARDIASSRMSQSNTSVIQQSTMPLSMNDRSRPHTEGQFCTQMLSGNLHLVTSTNLSDDNRPSTTVAISCMHQQSRTPFDAVPGFGEADLKRKLSGRKSKRGSDAARKAKKEVMARHIKVNTDEDLETCTGTGNVANIPFESFTTTSPSSRKGWISFDDEDVIQAEMEGLHTVSQGFSGIKDHIDLTPELQTASISYSRKQYADSSRSRVAQWISSEHLFTRVPTSQGEVEKQETSEHVESSIPRSELQKSQCFSPGQLNGNQQATNGMHVGIVTLHHSQQQTDQIMHGPCGLSEASQKDCEKLIHRPYLNTIPKENISNINIENNLFIQGNTLLSDRDVCTPQIQRLTFSYTPNDTCIRDTQLSEKYADKESEVNEPQKQSFYLIGDSGCVEISEDGHIQEDSGTTTQCNVITKPLNTSSFVTSNRKCFQPSIELPKLDLSITEAQGTVDDDKLNVDAQMESKEFKSERETKVLPPLDDYPPAPKDKRWAFWYKDCKRGKLLRRAEWVPVTITVEGGAIILCAVRENDNVQQEIPLLPFFAFNIPKLKEVEKHSKIHVAKLQYVKYKEKRNYSTKVGYHHTPVFTSILKLGAKDSLYLRAFMDTVEARIRLIPIHRDKGISYLFQEIFINCDDICHFLLSGNGDVIQYNITVQIHMLAFITGAPQLNLYLNDEETKNKGLHIENKNVTKWIQLHMAEFHQCVDSEASADNGCLTFVPPDGCRFEVLRFRVYNDKQLPVQVKSSLDLASSNAIKITAEVKAGLTEKVGRCVLHNVVMRIPMPDQWMSIFRKTRDINGKKHYMSASANPISLAPGICRGKRCAMKVSLGSVAVQPEFGAIIWRIGDLPFVHQGLPTDAAHTFSCHLELPFEIQLPDDFTPFAELEFYSPHALASEVCIRDVIMSTGIMPDKYIHYNSRYSYKVMLKVLNYGRAVSQESQ